MLGIYFELIPCRSSFESRRKAANPKNLAEQLLRKSSLTATNCWPRNYPVIFLAEEKLYICPEDCIWRNGWADWQPQTEKDADGSNCCFGLSMLGGGVEQA